MAAYLMVQSTINSEEQYQKYRESVVPLIMKFGGKSPLEAGRLRSSRANLMSGRWWCSSFQQWKPSTHSGIHRSISQ